MTCIRCYQTPCIHACAKTLADALPNELSAPISTRVPSLKKCFSTERRDEHAALLWHGLLPSSRDDARFIYNRSLLLLHHNPS